MKTIITLLVTLFGSISFAVDIQTISHRTCNLAVDMNYLSVNGSVDKIVGDKFNYILRKAKRFHLTEILEQKGYNVTLLEDTSILSLGYENGDESKGYGTLLNLPHGFDLALGVYNDRLENRILLDLYTTETAITNKPIRADITVEDAGINDSKKRDIVVNIALSLLPNCQIK